MQPANLIRSFRYYGWVIIGVSFLAFMVMNLSQQTITIFMKPILDEFGASRADAFMGISIAGVVGGFSGTLAGALCDRFGSRWIVAVGGVLVGLSLYAVSRITSIWQFYMAFGVLVSCAASCVGTMTIIPVLSNWFRRYRGTAITLAFVGLGATKFFSGPIEQVMGVWGWRGAFVFLGIACVVLITPWAALFLIDRPEDRGSRPDGLSLGRPERSGPSGSVPAPDRPSPVIATTLHEAAKTLPFWALVVAQFITPLGAQLGFFHFGTHLQDVGYSAGEVAHVWGNLMLCAAVATPLFGWFSDKLAGNAAFGAVGNKGLWRVLNWSPLAPRLLVLTAAYLLSSLGIFILLLIEDTGSPALLLLFTVIFGGSYTIRGPMFFAITVDLFEGPQQGRILGVTQLGQRLGMAVAPWFGGWMFDRLGSYHVAFYLGISCLLIACLCAWVAGVRSGAERPGAGFGVDFR